MIQLAAVSVSSDVVPFPRVRSHCENSPTKTDSTGWAPLTRPTGPWQPTCDYDAPVIPATVLDPFVGSSTTCAVAQKLGRRSVGLDASPDYLKLAARRIGAITLPMALGGGQ